MALSGYGVPDSGGYARQQNDLQYRYNTDKTANAYGRFLSQQRGERSMGDMERTFNRSLPNYRAGFSQRGLTGMGQKSGVAQRTFANYAGDYARDYQRTQQDLGQDMQQQLLADSQLDANYTNSLAALEIDKQNDIANAALAIEALRPLLGGI
jgi:hypothetical protein